MKPLVFAFLNELLTTYFIDMLNMELVGFEPTTFCLQGKHSPN